MKEKCNEWECECGLSSFPFREGFTVVREVVAGKEDVFFHVTWKRKPAYKERYADARPFSEGLAAVKDKNGWFHIHTDGKPAYKERYLRVGIFIRGRAVVKTVTERFYIDSWGRRLD